MTIRFSKATANDVESLRDLARETFIETHSGGIAAPDLQYYIDECLSAQVLTQELTDSKNLFYFLFADDQLAGYSKIIPDCSPPQQELKGATKLERIYLRKAFHGEGLGLALFQLNLDLCKRLGQTGIWLNVWTENLRAIEFYRKAGFLILHEVQFKISPTRSNPNHLMHLPL
jgi:diamine N-acetyltransferase